MKSLTLFISIFFISALAYSQCTFEKYYKIYSGDHSKTITTTDGGFVTIVGAPYDSLNPGFGNGQDFDICIVKTDACGKLVWQVHSGNPNLSESAIDVLENDSGDFIVTGMVFGQLALGNVVVYKFSKNGHFVWSKLYSSTTESLSNGIVKRKNKNTFIVTGGIFYTSEKGYIIEINDSGTILKSVILPYVNVEIIKTFQVNDSSYIMLLLSDSLYLIQTDTSFNVRWKKNLFPEPSKLTYQGNLDVCLSQDGRSIALAVLAVDSLYSFTSLTMRLNLNGERILYKGFPRIYGQPQFIAPTSNNGYIIGPSMLYVDSNFNVIKYFPTTDKFNSFVENTDKSITASGEHTAADTSYLQLVIVRTDNLGNIFHTDVTETKQKYNQSISIYPNPANTEVHIQTSSSEKLLVQLYDITGKQVTQVVSFTSSITINLNDVSEGLYFVRISNSNNQIIQTQKLSLVK
jgi:hypothetical protein